MLWGLLWWMWLVLVLEARGEFAVVIDLPSRHASALETDSDALTFRNLPWKESCCLALLGNPLLKNHHTVAKIGNTLWRRADKTIVVLLQYLFWGRKLQCGLCGVGAIYSTKSEMLPGEQVYISVRMVCAYKAVLLTGTFCLSHFSLLCDNGIVQVQGLQ